MDSASSAFIHKEKWAVLAAYIIYLVVLAFTIGHHELWGDELHSWNIAKASHSFTDLIANSRYEGHPPLWYTIMWVLSRFTHQLPYLQCIQFIIIASAVYLLMFRSALPGAVKVLVPFGYYFLFEYGVLSRNYAIGMLLAFAICYMLSRHAKPRLLLYYLLLFLLSTTHLLAVLAACSLHLYFLLQQKDQKRPVGVLLIYAISGILVVLPALYFIKPPTDSSLNFSFWASRWEINRLGVIASAPVRSLLPMPAWWNFHFWNTNFLFEPDSFLRLRRASTFIVSALLIVVVSFILRHNRKCLYLFLFNFLLTCLLGLVIPLTSTRYVGFIYISFILAIWMVYAEGAVAASRKWVILFFVIAQIPGGLFAVISDIHYPFSNAGKVRELIQEVPPGGKTVTDYWCVNNIVAYTDKPAYCIDLNRMVTHLQWDKQLFGAMISRKHYTNGIAHLLQETGLQNVYMISINSWQELLQKDTVLTKAYLVEMLDKREGAIEKSSNLYLYRISAR